jgi:hypothetical protein
MIWNAVAAQQTDKSTVLSLLGTTFHYNSALPVQDSHGRQCGARKAASSTT